jgi:hypothetical protein
MHTCSHKNKVVALAWRPKYSMLVTVGTVGAYFWNTDMGTLTHSINSPVCLAVRWYPSGNNFVTADMKGRVIVRV